MGSALELQFGQNCQIGKSLVDSYCEFGQFNQENKVNGVARVITQFGTILEGNFKNGLEDGWVRTLNSSGNMLYYTIAYYKEGELHHLRRYMKSDGTQV